MKYDDLSSHCIALKIPTYLYTLDDSCDDECVGVYFCKQWLVYAAERGKKHILLETDDELKACEQFMFHLEKLYAAYRGRSGLRAGE
jgi:hypothetical protein